MRFFHGSNDCIDFCGRRLDTTTFQRTYGLQSISTITAKAILARAETKLAGYLFLVNYIKYLGLRV
jgi:hypothetical protein